MTDRPTISDDELHAYVDGVLPRQDLPRVETWLAENPDDAAAVHAYRLQNTKLREAFDPVLDETVPRDLKAIVTRHRHRSSRHGSPWMKLAASVLLVVIGAGGGWLSHGWWNETATDPRGAFVRQAMGAHRVFVTEVLHPVEVPSSREAHLAAWLSKRVGTALRAPGLTALGFDLVGGRLLANGARPAAQFMYENQEGQRLTLYVRKVAAVENTAFRFASDKGNSAFYWVDKTFAYALIAPMERAELMPIVRKAYDDLESVNHK